VLGARRPLEVVFDRLFGADDSGVEALRELARAGEWDAAYACAGVWASFG